MHVGDVCMCVNVSRCWIWGRNVTGHTKIDVACGLTVGMSVRSVELRVGEMRVRL